ncbi:MAG: phage BR0599 family protein [Zoogloeaceae bacterium]|jgi:uncharacterized phage protein (TIGR02218 family)|nr:phage BR0599 family protein [Zoogloeaceae bacterium]
MPFDDLESSAAGGRPARLYEFSRQPASWCYTSADRDIHFQSRDYKSVAITDDGIRQTGEASADALTLTVPDSIYPVKMFIGHPPSDQIWLTLRDYHYGLADAPANALVVWIGNIKTVRWTDAGQAEIVCNSISASMARMGLRLSYERNCPHSLYDTSCRAVRASFALDTAVTALDGASVTVGAVNGAWNYTHGYLEWSTSNGFIERRGIEVQNGLSLTLVSGTAGMTAGQSVRIYPGCDQTSATCNGIFNNMPNYGGFRHMPGKSPFDNNPFF